MTNYSPDGLTYKHVTALVSDVSKEIGSLHAPTSALLDGSARAARNARMLARAAKGITPKYGVTLTQAVQEESAPVRAVPVATAPPTPIYGRKNGKSRRARRNAVRAQIARRVTGGQAA
jgi:hypothetical protein